MTEEEPVNLAVVIPVGAGREDNLVAVLRSLAEQTAGLPRIVIVEDGDAIDGDVSGLAPDALLRVRIPRHQPGMEQPRNVGVRMAMQTWPDTTHCWFVDSDIIVAPNALQDLSEMAHDDDRRIVVAPYDWLEPGVREPAPDVRNDPRWPSFEMYPPEKVVRNDLAAGLACFSGNLVWPVDEFARVGGFWNELHHGRCEDGELGLRAVAMDVGISFCATARGWHLWHPINTGVAIARNQRDVPMLNGRHPWVQGSDVFMVDRDGKAFDVRCPHCDELVPTNGWWRHAEEFGVAPRLEAHPI